MIDNAGIGSGVAEMPADSAQIPPRALIRGARYDTMMGAFGGKGFYVEDPKSVLP